jgi:hypothetical protein
MSDAPPKQPPGISRGAPVNNWIGDNLWLFAFLTGCIVGACFTLGLLS